MFRKDIFEQENSFFFKSCFLIPRYLTKSYIIPKADQDEFVKDALSNRDFSVKNVHNYDQKGLTEIFMKNFFKKCKKFVLEDWIDYDEIDCTMKCSLVHKKSFDVLQEVLKESRN
jgi:hypothetical protein